LGPEKLSVDFIESDRGICQISNHWIIRW